MKKFLSVFICNLIVWIIGTALGGWWILREVEINPVPLNPDGTLPGDSPSIPIAGCSVLLLIVLIVWNLFWFVAKKWRQNAATALGQIER
jgi:hypothetical protein